MVSNAIGRLAYGLCNSRYAIILYDIQTIALKELRAADLAELIDTYHC